MSREKTEQNKTAAADRPVTDFIQFPVRFNLHYRTILDAKNREVAVLTTLQTSDERRLRIGNFISEAINRASGVE